MPTYTVFALTSTDDPDAFLVAGVVAGEHYAVDDDRHEEPWGRYCTHVQATHPAAAELAAERQYRTDSGLPDDE